MVCSDSRVNPSEGHISEEWDVRFYRVHIQLACQEAAPEVYKPRKGRVNANMAKFKPMHLDFMMNYAQELIEKFGY